MPETVYMLVSVGVYDHGCFGVFTTREVAEDHARNLHKQSDGYHGMEVRECQLDTPVPYFERLLKSPLPDGSTEHWKQYQQRVATGTEPENNWLFFRGWDEAPYV